MNILWDTTVTEELNKKMKDKSFYITTDNKLLFSTSNIVNEIIMKNFTE